MHLFFCKQFFKIPVFKYIRFATQMKLDYYEPCLDPKKLYRTLEDTWNVGKYCSEHVMDDDYIIYKSKRQVFKRPYYTKHLMRFHLIKKQEK